VDFDEDKNQSHQQNVKKNRKTLLLLLAMFITPVILAYAAYFGQWFSGPGGAQGQLIVPEQVTDIEDYSLFKKNGDLFTGKEFETLYWWLIPLDTTRCDQECTNLNLYAINQTYIGLGKEASRINELLVVSKESDLNSGKFPIAFSTFTESGLKANEKTHSDKRLDLPANYIYLVDPLGNIFMRYPLIKNEKNAPVLSKKLRNDILHLFKYSRLG